MNVAIEQADSTAVQLSSLNEISKRLSSSLEHSDSIEIISYVGDKLMEIVPVEHIGIWLAREDTMDAYADEMPISLCLIQQWGSVRKPAADLVVSPTELLTYPDDLVVQAYQKGQTVTTFTPPPNPDGQGGWYISECGVMALPMLVTDHAIGVVVLQDYAPEERFTQAQQDTLQAIVIQAAIALDNMRLYAAVRRFNSDLEQLVEQRTAELQAEKDRLSTLNDIASEISSSLDLDTLLKSSLEALARITQVHFGSIMLVERDIDHLVNRAVLGRDDVDTFTRFPIGQGVAGWVAQNKMPALIPDITDDERWMPPPDDEPVRKRQGSLIAVPLIVHDQRLGVLTLSHEQPHYFNEDHLRLLMASAGAISIGIHNANLYTDIVDEMEHRSELLRNQQMETSKIGAILQSLSDGVLVCDIDGSVLSLNPACGSILEKGVEELVLSNLHDILKNLLGSRVDELPLNELIERPTGANDQPRIFDSTVTIGKRVVNLALGPVLKDDGEFVGALLVLRDKTREVESDRLKTEFIGTMSHELRTPMTSIKGFTQLLAMGSLGPVNDTQREFLQTIQNNAERMIAIINDVLELTKIETGSVELEVRPLHLAEALSGVVSELQSMANNREHELTISIPPGLPLVKADATRLHQIFYNLISNAIKYTPNGGKVLVEACEGNIEEFPQRVRDSVVADRRYTRIDVRDTGVGIAEHELERVFDRFYRTENPMKIEAGGTGLGLSLAKPLVELMGGRVWAESTPGEGTTFSLILPAV
jgi:signal transduction histidine kinase